MNVEWCLRELATYIELADSYDSKNFTPRGDYAGDAVLKPIVDDLREREPIVKRILNQVQPGLGNTRLVKAASYGVSVTTGRDLAKYALGYLKRRAEVEANLGSPAPKMQADRLHPWVWDAARTLWETKHYRAAVQAAGTSVNAHSQDLVGRRDVSDLKLMSECFSDKDPEPGKPRLRWPGDPTDEGVKSMNNGLRLYAQGAFGAVRNPATHKLDELTEHQALERLAVFSLLSNLIADCEVVEATTPTPIPTAAAAA